MGCIAFGVSAVGAITPDGNTVDDVLATGTFVGAGLLLRGVLDRVADVEYPSKRSTASPVIHGRWLAPGLPPDVVDAWRARIGADDPAGDNTTHYVRRTDATGWINRHPNSNRDDSRRLRRDLLLAVPTDLLVYVALRTPCTVCRGFHSSCCKPSLALPGLRHDQFPIWRWKVLPGAETVVNDSR